MKKTILFVALSLSLLSVAAQNAVAQAKKPTAKKTVAKKAAGNMLTGTKDGMQYKIIRKMPESGMSPKMGDIVEMNIKVHVGDSALFDSRLVNGNKPVSFPIQKPTFTSDPVKGFMMMKPGDSAVFYVKVDSLKKSGAQLPPWMKAGDRLEYNVSLVSVKSAAEAKEQAEQAGKAQAGIDTKVLNDYFGQNHITPLKTPMGVYYTITKEGMGEKATTGQTVVVNYTGKTLDGKTFDSNVDSNFHHVSPFSFTLGKHQVIAGWDDGIPMIKKGGKGTLYIPSPLAYGAQSPSPAIPANSVLVFDVEVTDIK
jgi:FKBP-type peptidyl-prolyl cis-trans isomerase FkpA